jgi:hypothetical protein
MTKLWMSILISLLSLSAYAQRFAQYNTGTLFDSFENPSQAAFIPDSSRNIAFNFLIPNINLNAYLQGNTQYSLKSRLFLDLYNNEAVTIGQNQYNNALANVNVYLGMLKLYTSAGGRQEIGVSYQVKANGRGHVTDETVALFNGIQKFTENNYTDVFNNNAFYESFHQFSATYREKVTQNFSVGIKLSLLSGIAYNKINITESGLNIIDRGTLNPPAGGTADWRLKGTYQSTYEPDNFQRHDLLPTFKNRGLAGSIGATYIAPGGIILQGNLKDLGFIRWAGDATTYTFNNVTRIVGLNTTRREVNVGSALTRLIDRMPETKPFIKPIVGRAEFSAAKKFMFGTITYLPTAIVSRQVYGLGTAAALVNNVQFGNFGTTLSGIVNENKLFDIGLQLMYKTPNFEFFIGSEQLTRSMNLYSASGDNENAINKTMSHSGGNIYLGFSLKFGKKIERWKTESYYYNGSEQGPLGKAWRKVFN